jgi:hypothetical protein
MRKVRYVAIAFVALSLVGTGVLLASNMGFKLNKTLVAATQASPTGGTSADGTNELALPFNRQIGINTAEQLRNDIGVPLPLSIQRLIHSTNGLQFFTGGRTNNFSLTAGECYRVRVSGTTNQQYIAVGSHDPALTVTLYAATQAAPTGGVSADGTNTYGYPYHSTAANAEQIRNEIGAANVLSVQRLIHSTNGLQFFTGGRTNNFTLSPGECYRVRVGGTTNRLFVPSHY